MARFKDAGDDAPRFDVVRDLLVSGNHRRNEIQILLAMFDSYFFGREPFDVNTTECSLGNFVGF